MTELQPAVTLDFPSAQLPAMITRLTTYLLQQHYSFLQTREHGEQTTFEIFDAGHRRLLSLTLRAGMRPRDGETPSAEGSPPLSADAAALVAYLLGVEPAHD